MADFMSYLKAGADAVSSSASEIYDWAADGVTDLFGSGDSFSIDTFSEYGMSPSEYAQYGDTFADYGMSPGEFLSTYGADRSGGFMSSALDTVGSAYDAAKSWATSDSVKNWAGATGAILYGKSGFKPTAPSVKGARLSGASSPAGSSQFNASAVDLGYTGKVQNAMNAISRGRVVGGAIDGTVAMLRARGMTGPLLQISQTPINVRSRAKGTSDA
jgi:hypothetical protein